MYICWSDHWHNFRKAPRKYKNNLWLKIILLDRHGSLESDATNGE